MKKLFALTTSLIALFLLTACGTNLNGTWKASDEDASVDYTMTIKDETVTMTGETVIGDIDFEGTIDKKEKTIDGTGTFWGIDQDMTMTYEVKDDKLVVDFDGDTIEFEKAE